MLPAPVTGPTGRPVRLRSSSRGRGPSAGGASIVGRVLQLASSLAGRLTGSEDADKLSIGHRRKSSKLVPVGGRQGALKLVAIVAAVVLAAWTLLSWLFSAAGRTEATKYRVRQALDGFTESRLAALPADLRDRSTLHHQSVDDLLAHSVLRSAQVPACSLQPAQQHRYEPLSATFHKRKRTPVHFATNTTQGRPLSYDVPRTASTYLIAINLSTSSAVLPSLIRAIVALTEFMGKERFHISIYENGSTDTTPQQLYLFAAILEQLGIGFSISSDPKPAGWVEGSRIAGLAALRTRALQPLLEGPRGAFTGVLFLNDVHLCFADLLEVILMHELQEADQTCGMDYKTLRIPEFEESGFPLLFYDVWVARDMLGLPFYNIKRGSGEWELPSLPLPHSPDRFRLHSLLPFQAYSCFNGVVAFDASLFLPPHSLRFRAEKGADSQSECFLLSKDIWLARWRQQQTAKQPRKGEKQRGARIQVVPRASVGYELQEYEQVRKDTNLTDWTAAGGTTVAFPADERIEWKSEPPKLVASYPYARWEKVAWVPSL